MKKLFYGSSAEGFEEDFGDAVGVPLTDVEHAWWEHCDGFQEAEMPAPAGGN